jgi:hypothetical protein
MVAKSPLELYLIAVFALFAGFAVLVAYVSDDTGLAYLGRRYNLSSRDALVVTSVAILVPTILAVVGSLSEVAAFYGLERYEFRAKGMTLLFNWGLFIAGLFASVSAYNHLVSYRRLRRDGVRVGTVSVVSGVTTGRPADSPVCCEPAFCWSWKVGVQNRFGTTDDRWTVTEIGAGGVPFEIQTDDGPVHVDPGGAQTRLSLVGESTHEVEPGDPLRAAISHEAVHEVDTKYRHKPRRYVERVVAPGSAVTVTGQCVERAGDHWLEGTPSTDLVVSEGGLSSTVFRYRVRIVAAVLIGVLATWAGLSYLTAFFSV